MIGYDTMKNRNLGWLKERVQVLSAFDGSLLKYVDPSKEMKKATVGMGSKMHQMPKQANPYGKMASVGKDMKAAAKGMKKGK